MSVNECLIIAITTTSNGSSIPAGSLVHMYTNMNNLSPTLLPCDGRSIAKDEYPSLFNALNVEPKYIEKKTWFRTLLKKIGIIVPCKKVLNPKYNDSINIPDLREHFIINPLDSYPTITTE